MSHGIRRALHRFALFIAAAALSTIAQVAQDAKPAPNSSNSPANTAIPTTTPNLNHPSKGPVTPPPGKMRGITNEMRWQAAKRTADRKAHAHVSTKMPVHPAEVKQ